MHPAGAAGVVAVADRHHPPPLAAVVDLGLHPDPEPVQRRRELRAEAGLAVEPRVVADPHEPERDVELALGVSSSESTTSPSATGSRSCDTRLCRNENASGPWTTTRSRARTVMTSTFRSERQLLQ